MAFTNFLAQSLVLGWMFCGYGGLFNRLNVTTAFAIGVGVHNAQVAFGTWLLSWYRYDRVVVMLTNEWRAATDGSTLGLNRRLLLTGEPP